MITEIARITVKPGMHQEFEAGLDKAIPHFRRATGCHGVDLFHCIESPDEYRLLVRWQTVENHTVDFCGSSDFEEFRKLVWHCFASPPAVEHVRQVIHGF